LHLCGYDHEQDAGEMNELELQVRDKLGVKWAVSNENF
jgi:ssRNA-specific RNase YbeY (16S rRNA maturation enzyme)